MLDYVSYDVDREDVGGEEASESITCPQCFKSQNIDEVLSKQVLVAINSLNTFHSKMIFL